MTGAPPAYTAGLRLLARRELSAAQIRQRLARQGFPPDEIDGALDRLRQEGALDDRRMARAYASTAARVKGRGRQRILRELEATGVDHQTALAALDEVFDEVNEATLLERALAKRLRGPIRDAGQFRRLHQYLTRLGFPPAAIAGALRARMKGGAIEDE
jgi:regulatory protein